MSDPRGFYEQTNGAAPTDTSFRKKWDKAEYEQKARDRANRDRLAEENEERKAKGLKPKQPKDKEKEPEPTELLKAREEKVVLDEMLGKTQVVNAASNQGAGYYCKVCDTTLRDSVAWLDHINGRKHQLALGVSMRVERSTLEQVKERLEMLKRKKLAPKEEYNLDNRIKMLVEKEKEEKERRKEAKRQRKLQTVAEPQDAEASQMQKMMGFAGFGSTKA